MREVTMRPKREVSSSLEAWQIARRKLLKREKALTQLRELVAAERQQLPWLQIEKEYVFDTDRGRKNLGELFGDCSQLVVHHLMFHPDWNAACPGCTFQADHIDGPAPHLLQKDVRVIAVSRAPLGKLQAYRDRLGWNFEWVSSQESDFNFDFGVSYTKEQLALGRVDYNFGTITVDSRYQSEELPGVSVFYKDGDGSIYLTYATFARGLDDLLGTNHYLDIAPLGRNEAAYPKWPRRRYEYDGAVESDCHVEEAAP